MEELISLNEYMKRYKVGYAVVKKMIANGELEARTTPGGQYRIVVGGDTVSRQIYEEEKKKRIEAETIIRLLSNILNERRVS